MSSCPVKVVIVGFSGLIGRRHTKHVLSNSSTELVAVVDPSPGAPEVAASLGITAPLFRSVSELLGSQRNRPEAAIVCTPNHTHAPIATELINNGIHVLVEKPLADNVLSGQAVVDLAREKNVQLLVGHHRRFNPYVISTKNALTSGLLGSVTAVSALWTLYKPREYFDRSPALAWRKSVELGGGVVLINFVHEADIMQFLFGPIVRVHAEKCLSRRSAGDGGVEEGVVLIMRFASGVVGTYVLSDAVVSPHNFEMGTGENPLLPRVRDSCGDEVDIYRVFGTDGTLSVPDMTLWSYSGTKSWEEALQAKKLHLDGDPRVPFERQLDHFVSVVRGLEAPSCTGEDGLQALKVCDAIHEALNSETGTANIE